MIPYGKHSVDDNDIKSVVEALQSDWLTTGPTVELFEHALEKIVGVPTVSVSSGTAALHCAYAAIGIERGDEIITPPNTFIATQATAALMGAKIVFADIEGDTGNIDPKAVEAAVTSRTKAIVAVDYAGHPADMDKLRSIADKYGVYLIEDAAHSIGSFYKGRPVGSLADVTAFSFFPTKNLTTAEGGAIASNHSDLLDRARRFARQGLIRDPSKFKIQNEGAWHQEVHEFGLNYRLPDVLCALGISQLKRINEFKAKRLEIFQAYSRAFDENQNILTPVTRENVEPMWHLYPIRVQSTKRKIIFTQLRESGIGVQVNYIPAYFHPVFDPSSYPKGLCPVSEKFYSEEISLPIHFGLAETTQRQIISKLLSLDLEMK
jgi:dTDP-4-amino-4,6-dideoxygalactose transaminase